MAIALEQLMLELRLQGAAPTKQQLKDVKTEVRNLETAFATLGSGFGIGYLLTQIGDLLRAFAEISGLSIAAEFRGVTGSLEAVLRNSKQTAQVWRELRTLGNQIGVNPATLGGIAAQMIGGGDSPAQVLKDMPRLMDALAYGRVKSADIDPFLFNLQQIKSVGSAKADFTDIREMINRAPGIRSILAAGFGIENKDLMKTLRGKSMSGDQVYEAILKGSEAMAKGAAAARALSDPLFAVSSLFLTLRQVMEPTGQILVTIGMPFITLGRILANAALKINQWSGGVAGLALLIGGGVVIATRTATVALIDFAKAMLGTAVAARAGTGIAAIGSGAAAGAGAGAVGLLGGGLIGRLWGSLGGSISKFFSRGILGTIIAGVSNFAGDMVAGDGKNPMRSLLGDMIKGAGIGAGIGALFGLPGALIGGGIGLIGGIGKNLYENFFGSKDKAGAAADPVASNTKRMADSLDEIKVQFRNWGGGPATAGAVSSFGLEWQMAKVAGI